MKVLVLLLFLSLISCGNDNRTSLIPPMISYLILSGIIDTSPDLCGEDRSRSTLITSGFTSSGTLNDSSRTVYYRVLEESNVVHTITLQTNSTNCDSIYLNFDTCKFNRRNGNLRLQCNFPTFIGSGGWNGSVSKITGINNIRCSIQSNNALTFIQIGTAAETTRGGCEWSLQYNKN